MDKEALVSKLKEEGFVHVYEWTDAPNTKYEKHAHKGAVALYILDGSVTFTIERAEKEVRAEERFDVPVGVEHEAVVGANGCTFLVGEMIEGDS